MNTIRFCKEETNDMLLYTMMKKQFYFESEFEELGKGKFGDSSKDVVYFGIDEYTVEKEKFRNQIEVLFYDSDTDFAIKLYTKGQDRIILYRTDATDDFESIFRKIKQKKNNYMRKLFTSIDTLKIPSLSFGITKDYTELTGESFIRKRDHNKYLIHKAIQAIDFKLDKTGGIVKSEAAMLVMITGVPIGPRNFNFDDTFYMFLIEEGNEMPYLALRVEDIYNWFIGMLNNISSIEKISFYFSVYYSTNAENKEIYEYKHLYTSVYFYEESTSIRVDGKGMEEQVYRVHSYLKGIIENNDDRYNKTVKNRKIRMQSWCFSIGFILSYIIYFILKINIDKIPVEFANYLENKFVIVFGQWFISIIIGNILGLPIMSTI